MKYNKKEYKKQKYPIDSGGIIHMASLVKGYANTFRIKVVLKDIVDFPVLQEAFKCFKPSNCVPAAFAKISACDFNSSCLAKFPWTTITSGISLPPSLIYFNTTIPQSFYNIQTNFEYI